MGQVKKIVIADRSPVYREGLKIALGNDRGFSFIDVDDVEQLFAGTVQGFKPDLVIIDDSVFRNKDKNRILDFISVNHVSVVFTSGRPEPARVEVAKECGAKGLFFKTCTLENIKQTILAVLAGGEFWPDPAGLSSRKLNIATTKQVVLERIKTLTPKEKVVLPYLKDGKPYKQIAYELGLNQATIKYHAQNIRRKMQSRNRTHLVSLLTC